jgi:hypothetical protein
MTMECAEFGLKMALPEIFDAMLGARRPLAVGEMAFPLGLTTLKQCRTSLDARVDPNHLGKQLRNWCGFFVFVNQSRIYLIHDIYIILDHNNSFITELRHTKHMFITVVSQTLNLECQKGQHVCDMVQNFVRLG